MWTVDIYLNEAGWDGQHDVSVFSTEDEAKAAEAELHRIWAEEVPEKARDHYVLETQVYQSEILMDGRTWAQNTVAILKHEIDWSEYE